MHQPTRVLALALLAAAVCLPAVRASAGARVCGGSTNCGNPVKVSNTCFTQNASGEKVQGVVRPLGTGAVCSFSKAPGGTGRSPRDVTQAVPPAAREVAPAEPLRHSGDAAPAAAAAAATPAGAGEAPVAGRPVEPASIARPCSANGVECGKTRRDGEPCVGTHRRRLVEGTIECKAADCGDAKCRYLSAPGGTATGEREPTAAATQ